MGRPGRKPGKPKTGGRVKGTKNKATREVKEMALEYAPMALKELARLVTQAESETARVSAIREILDRAYGKPAQPQAVSGKIDHDHKHHHTVEPLSDSAQWVARMLGRATHREAAEPLLN